MAFELTAQHFADVAELALMDLSVDADHAEHDRETLAQWLYGTYISGEEGVPPAGDPPQVYVCEAGHWYPEEVAAQRPQWRDGFLGDEACGVQVGAEWGGWAVAGRSVVGGVMHRSESLHLEGATEQDACREGESMYRRLSIAARRARMQAERVTAGEVPNDGD